MYQAVICSLRRRGYLPLEYPSSAVIDSVNGYQRGGLHNGRLPQNCIERITYQVYILMQFFAMTRFIIIICIYTIIYIVSIYIIIDIIIYIIDIK